MANDQLNGFVKYTSRDYNSLVSEFFDIVPKLTDLWRPESDSDPGVVLGKYLASIADMLGVNLDLLANEIFAPSVSQRKNAEKIFGLIGYYLGWYTAARTEVTFTNNSDTDMVLNFGFNGGNFATLNAYTDITNTDRVITYNILPLTNKYGAAETRSKRQLVSENLNIFAESDKVTLRPNESVTRVAIEGELRNWSVSVADVIKNNYIIKIPSQHIDTTAIWIKDKPSSESENFKSRQWIQVTSPADFVSPEPRFAVTYDSYSNAQIQVSSYLNQLENYSDGYLVVYWFDCTGVIGCVNENVLQNYLQAVDSAIAAEYVSNETLVISNLSNTLELPHTHTVTGKSPETAKEAYHNSRNYINTNDSLITLPDFNRFINREPGVDCGYVLDCQKALEINLAIYNDKNLTDSQKSKMYITKYDFPEGDPIFDWKNVLNLGFDPTDPNKFIFAANFKRYTAMVYCIHNDFLNSSFGQGETAVAKVNNKPQFIQYKPPFQFQDAVRADYRPLQAMSVELEFGYLRIFPFYIVGDIYTKQPVDITVGATIVNKVKEALQLYFSPGSRSIGQKPTVMDVVNVVQSADDRISYFDAGGLKNPVINWTGCDIDYFNPISFAKYTQSAASSATLRIASDCLINS